MKRLIPNQQGLIPILICILLVLAAVIYVAYQRVASVQH